jgi:ribosomal protein S18 acetylase RimI-like enzyme
MTRDALELRRGSAADLAALEPLWVAVHHRHAESMPELAPYVSDARTWELRSRLYAELLAKPDTVLVLAKMGEALVGYGLAHVMEIDDTWIPDTWVTGDRIGEIESLSVLPEHRGQGIGERLMDALERALHEAGVADVIVGVLPGNDGAVRLYERRGYRPTWAYLSRFAGRSAPRGGG